MGKALDISLASASYIGLVYLRDATTGNGKTGVASGDLSGSYSKEDNSAETALSFAAGSVGDAFSSGKWAELGNGYYLYHFPDAAFDTLGQVGFSFRATGCIDAAPKYQVVAYDPEDSASLGLTARAVVVIPAASVIPDRGDADESHHTIYTGETISYSVNVFEYDGETPVDLSGETLTVIFEKENKTDLATVPSGSITVSGDDSNVVTFNIPEAVTDRIRLARYTIRREAGDGYVFSRGWFDVQYAPEAD